MLLASGLIVAAGGAEERVFRAGAATSNITGRIGLELKERSPFKPSFTISLANGYNGYLPTPQKHEWGGYETWRAKSSYLEEDASTKIVARLL